MPKTNRERIVEGRGQNSEDSNHQKENIRNGTHWRRELIPDYT
jgi:hypothetical protein